MCNYLRDDEWRKRSLQEVRRTLDMSYSNRTPNLEQPFSRRVCFRRRHQVVFHGNSWYPRPQENGSSTSFFTRENWRPSSWVSWWKHEVESNRQLHRLNPASIQNFVAQQNSLFDRKGQREEGKDSQRDVRRTHLQTKTYLLIDERKDLERQTQLDNGSERTHGDAIS